jgi:hypothetical protein
MSARILYITTEVAMKDKASLKHQKVPNPYLPKIAWLLAGIGSIAVWAFWRSIH